MKLHKLERFIVYPFLVGLLVLFAFYDLPIMQNLYDPTNVFGRLGENVSEIPLHLLGVYASFLLFKTRNKEVKWKNILFGIIYIVLAVFYAGYGGALIRDYTKAATYGFPGWLPWVLAVVVGLGYFGLGFFAAWKTPITKRENVMAWALFVVIIYAAMFVTMNVFKFIWHRPRWRYLVTLEGDPASMFVPVYHLGMTGGFSNNYASFPSGHTMNALALIVFSLFGYVDEKFESSAFLIRLFAYVWAVLCAISRIIMGAHFASDVTAGFLLGFLVYDLMSTFLFPALLNKFQKTQPLSEEK